MLWVGHFLAGDGQAERGDEPVVIDKYPVWVRTLLKWAVVFVGVVFWAWVLF